MSGKKKTELTIVHDLLNRLRKSVPQYLGGFEIDPSERPDFILTTGATQIGLEITESVFQEFRRGEILPYCPKTGPPELQGRGN